MLLDIEDKILKKLNKTKTNKSSELNLKYCNADIYEAMLDLEKLGYLKNVSANIDLSEITFETTIYARYYNEYINKQRISYIGKTIVVSIVTSILTNILIQLI